MSSKAPARGQIPALDGIRGVAVLTVMIYHFSIFGEMTADTFVDAAYRGFVVAGWSGVDLFFVLSGFLITGIIVDTKATPNFFRNFYARRFLRIFPLYYAFLAIYFFVIGHFFPGFTRQTDGRHIWYWTFTCNILAARLGYLDSTISHFWSLAVEEQFYLVWPAVVYMLSRRALLRTSVVLLVASFALRVVLILHHEPFTVYYSLTPCRFDALAAGAIVALLVRSDLPLAALARAGRRAASAGAVALFVMVIWRRGLHAHDAVVATVGYSLLAVTFAGVVAATVGAPAGSWLSRTLGHPHLRFFGRYSYGMYVLHAPLGFALEHAQVVVSRFPRLAGSHLPAVLVLTVAGIAGTTAAAWTSWHLLEAPLLRLKRYFEYNGDAGVNRATDNTHAATEVS